MSCPKNDKTRALTSSGVTRIFSRGASGEKFPQNITGGEKLQNLLEVVHIVNVISQLWMLYYSYNQISRYHYQVEKKIGNICSFLIQRCLAWLASKKPYDQCLLFNVLHLLSPSIKCITYIMSCKGLRFLSYCCTFPVANGKWFEQRESIHNVKPQETIRISI